MAGIDIKLAVDSSRSRVLFADAGSDFVDVLLSFLTLPLSAVQLCAGASSPGCLSSLRDSVSQLDDSNLLTADACHGMLLRPHVDELKYVMERVAHVYKQAAEDMFVEGKRRFVISDDLTIKPASTSSTLTLLQKMGSGRVGHDFEEIQVYVGWAECMKLKTSFINLQRLALIPFHSLELKIIVVQGKWELCAIHQFGR
nr:unnamed protein product [Digitaria exilis]